MRDFIILLTLYLTIVTCFITCKAGTSVSDPGNTQKSGQLLTDLFS